MKPKDFENIVIEKNIPIAKKERKGMNSEYPWDKMEIGDSFHVDVPEGKKINTVQSSVHAIARIYALYNHLNIKFTTRKEEGGFRIWRIE